MSNQLNEQDIKQFYEEITEIWPSKNPWYVHANKEIYRFLHRHCFAKDSYVLNAGSAGNSYGLPYRMHHVDIAENKIAHLQEATVASVESLPFIESSFDNAICVGSVINYCDAFATISELHRVLKKGGSLVLEFENSFGFEYRKTEAYKKPATIVNVKYIKVSHYQWLYSGKYIFGILKEAGFNLAMTYHFHIASALYLRKHDDERKAAEFVKFDHVLKHIPRIKQHANNIIVLCKKS